MLENNHLRKSWFSNHPKETLNFSRVFLGHSWFHTRYLYRLATTINIHQLPTPTQNYFISCEILS